MREDNKDKPKSDACAMLISDMRYCLTVGAPLHKTIIAHAIIIRTSITSRQFADLLGAPKGIETLVRVPNEWQAGRIFILTRLRGLRPVCSACVVLINLVNGEVLRVNVGLQLGLKRRTDAAKTIPRDTTEEGMLPDFACATNATNTMLGITDQARRIFISFETCERTTSNTHRLTKSSASAPSCWSGGKCRLRGQSTILRYVSCGSSAQNGGQPIRHSNMIVPTDHQSHPKSYP